MSDDLLFLRVPKAEFTWVLLRLCKVGLLAFVIIYIIRLRRALGKEALSYSGLWDTIASLLMMVGMAKAVAMAIGAVNMIWTWLPLTPTAIYVITIVVTIGGLLAYFVALFALLAEHNRR